jgi:hypothetical protein
MWATCNFCSSLRVRYGSFGTGFEVFPFLIVAINHPTTPPPHVMLHQPRFWSCWVRGRRTEEGVPQHLLDMSAGKGRNEGERIIYVHSSHPPPFSYSSFLYFLHYNLFFFTIRRLSEFQLFVINKDQHRHSRLLTTSQLIFQTQTSATQ